MPAQLATRPVFWAPAHPGVGRRPPGRAPGRAARATRPPGHQGAHQVTRATGPGTRSTATRSTATRSTATRSTATRSTATRSTATRSAGPCLWTEYTNTRHQVTQTQTRAPAPGTSCAPRSAGGPRHQVGGHGPRATATRARPPGRRPPGSSCANNCSSCSNQAANNCKPGSAARGRQQLGHQGAQLGHRHQVGRQQLRRHAIRGPRSRRTVAGTTGRAWAATRPTGYLGKPDGLYAPSVRYQAQKNPARGRVCVIRKRCSSGRHPGGGG